MLLSFYKPEKQKQKKEGNTDMRKKCCLILVGTWYTW